MTQAVSGRRSAKKYETPCRKRCIFTCDDSRASVESVAQSPQQVDLCLGLGMHNTRRRQPRAWRCSDGPNEPNDHACTNTRTTQKLQLQKSKSCKQSQVPITRPTATRETKTFSSSKPSFSSTTSVHTHRDRCNIGALTQAPPLARVLAAFCVLAVRNLDRTRHPMTHPPAARQHR